MVHDLTSQALLSRVAAAVALAVVASPHPVHAIEQGGFRFAECRHVECEARIAPNGVSAVVKIRGRSARDAGHLLDLTLYDAATYEVAYHDTAELPPAGDFAFRVGLDSLRPGRYAFVVGPRYSRALVGIGALTAIPSLVPATPWPSQSSSESRP